MRWFGPMRANLPSVFSQYSRQCRERQRPGIARTICFIEIEEDVVRLLSRVGLRKPQPCIRS
jgi:hypothetical protein